MQKEHSQAQTYELAHLPAKREELEEWIPQSKSKSVQKINKNRWTSKENKLYIEYLKKNKDKFKDKQSRKKGKVFLRLAKQIKKRTYQQVKSHHQKMIIKYKNIDTIIREFEATFILDLQLEEPLIFKSTQKPKEIEDLPSTESFSTILNFSNITELKSSNKICETTQNFFDFSMSNQYFEWFQDI